MTEIVNLTCTGIYFRSTRTFLGNKIGSHLQFICEVLGNEAVYSEMKYSRIKLDERASVPHGEKPDRKDSESSPVRLAYQLPVS